MKHGKNIVFILLLALALALGLTAAQADVEVVHISGEVKLSEIPHHAGVILDGDTTLNVDNSSDGTSIFNLAYIRGYHDLDIKGSGYPFGIRNDVDSDPAIQVRALRIENQSTVISALKGDGIEADNVYITCNRLTLYAPCGAGITSFGDVELYGGNYSAGDYSIMASGNCIQAGNWISISECNLYCKTDTTGLPAIWTYEEDGLFVWEDNETIRIPSSGKVSDDGREILTSGGKSSNEVKITKGTPPSLYSVTFNRNGLGTGTPMQQKIWANGYAAEPGYMKEDGYKMVGWSKYSGNYTRYNWLWSTKENTIIYAIWMEASDGSFGGNVTWEFEGNRLEVHGEGAMNPDDPAFTPIPAALRTKIKSIYIDNEVTTIADQVFKDCTTLEFVQLGSKTAHIGDKAFMGCTSLKTVNNPKKCHFGYASFYKCTSLEIMRFHDEDVIEQDAFSSTALWLVQLGNSMRVEKEAFGGLDTLEKVLLPDYVIVDDDNGMHRWAFYGCFNLTFYCRPDSETALEYVVKGWSGDGDVVAGTLTLPDNLKKIEAQAFAGLDQPLIIRINSIYVDIDPNAFKNTDNIILDLDYTGGDIRDWCEQNHIVNVIDYY